MPTQNVRKGMSRRNRSQRRKGEARGNVILKSVGGDIKEETCLAAMDLRVPWHRQWSGVGQWSFGGERASGVSGVSGRRG